MLEHGEILSIQATADRLGVSRWRVWQMIADGALEMESRRWQGRLVPGVRLPELGPGQTIDQSPNSPRSLRRQIERLSRSMEMLVALVTELSSERTPAYPTAPKAGGSPPPADAPPASTPRMPATWYERVASEPPAQGATPLPAPPPQRSALRPNPMTTPSEDFQQAATSREDALASVGDLFQRPASRSWWQRG